MYVATLLTMSMLETVPLIGVCTQNVPIGAPTVSLVSTAAIRLPRLYLYSIVPVAGVVGVPATV